MLKLLLAIVFVTVALIGQTAESNPNWAAIKDASPKDRLVILSQLETEIAKKTEKGAWTPDAPACPGFSVMLLGILRAGHPPNFF